MSSVVKNKGRFGEGAETSARGGRAPQSVYIRLARRSPAIAGRRRVVLSLFPTDSCLRFVHNRFGRRLIHFELGARFLDLRGVLFQLGRKRLYLLLLLRDRCSQS